LWSPIYDVKFRGSFATGFLPPALYQLVPQPQVEAFSFDSDPLRGNTFIGGPVQQLLGGGSFLQPERSKSLSFGVIFTPTFLRGLRASVDFNKISKTDEIVLLSIPQILANEGVLLGRVMRADPSPEDAALGWAGQITLIDTRYFNLVKSRVKAIDLQVDYDANSSQLGNLRLYAVATRTLSFKRQLTSATAFYDAVDKSDGPLEWRGNIGVDWSKGSWNASWNMQYYAGYSLRFGDPSLNSSVGETSVAWNAKERIRSQAYHDFSITYRFDASSPLVKGLELNLAIRNAFDTKPPAIASPTNGYSALGDPRLRRIAVTLKKHFGN
jgi:outer membrane receptor protein involved in Fe transport